MGKARMKILILGSTGLLGQAMSAELVSRGHQVVGAARRNADVAVDVADASELASVLMTQDPTAVINCAALVDVDACEKDPGLAWKINARPLSIIADWARGHERPFVHISTDQFFLDGGRQPHAEDAPVAFVNEYARTKFAGEGLASTVPQALVLRTSIVGIRGWEKPTFAEWAIDVVENDKAANLFCDAYTSSVDVVSFSKAAIDMLEKGARGLYNLAASEVYSKEEFVREVAHQLGKPLSNATTGSVSSLSTKRANCLGLDVTRAERILAEKLPSLRQVVASVLSQHKGRKLS